MTVSFEINLWLVQMVAIGVLLGLVALGVLYWYYKFKKKKDKRTLIFIGGSMSLAILSYMAMFFFHTGLTFMYDATNSKLSYATSTTGFHNGFEYKSVSIPNVKSWDKEIVTISDQDSKFDVQVERGVSVSFDTGKVTHVMKSKNISAEVFIKTLFKTINESFYKVVADKELDSGVTSFQLSYKWRKEVEKKLKEIGYEGVTIETMPVTIDFKY